MLNNDTREQVVHEEQAWNIVSLGTCGINTLAVGHV